MLTIVGIVGLATGVGWLFNCSVLISVNMIAVNVVLVLYYARLILKGKNNKYLISSIEKVQKG